MLRIETVAEIKARLDSGESIREVARKTGISRRTVSRIKSGDRPLSGLQEVHLDDQPETAEYFKRMIEVT